METNEIMDNVDTEVINDTMPEVVSNNRGLIIGGVAAGAAALVAIAYKFGKPRIEKAIKEHKDKKAFKLVEVENVTADSDEK